MGLGSQLDEQVSGVSTTLEVLRAKTVSPLLAVNSSEGLSNMSPKALARPGSILGSTLSLVQLRA